MPADAAVQQAADGDYRLGSADKVRITVFGEPTLTGEFVVGPAGDLSLPLIGSVAASGLTTMEVGQAIQLKLASGYLRDPQVSIDVLTYRPFYILGEVNQPGEYPFSARLTVINAVATAKGFTYRANQGRVFIKSAGSQVEREVPLTSDLLVQPGDTLRFGERYF
nr:polysaccharide biosynthesis/export family protein [Brevundimonas sp. LM2]